MLTCQTTRRVNIRRWGKNRQLVLACRQKVIVVINVDVSQVIDRPASDVFRFVSDFENHPNWEAHFLGVKRITPGPIGVGTRFECLLKMPGRRAETFFEIVSFDPDRSFAYEADRTGPVKPMGSFSFEPVGDGSATRVHSMPAPEVHGVMKILEPLMALYIARQNRHHLAQLKEILEKQNRMERPSVAAG